MPDLWHEIQNLPAEQKELLLDVVQAALDVGGMIEPTPACDGVNGLISLYRRDWFGAGVSLVSVVPYVGDLAKGGKLGRYAQTIEKAVRMAAHDVAFRRLLAPVLAKIVKVCESVPYTKLPAPIRSAIDDIYRAARKAQGAGRAVTHLERLTDEMLVRVFGSTKNVGLLPRRNMRTVVEFFEKHNVDEKKLAAWADKCKGIDFHKPVEVQRLHKGERVATYVEMHKPADKRVGQWLVPERGAVSHRNLGLSDGGGNRQRWVLVVEKEHEVLVTHEVLKSSAAHTVDTWTKGHVPTGHRGGEIVAGGGTQLFLPDAYKYLKKVAGPD